jgi:hypothetical protein
LKFLREYEVGSHFKTLKKTAPEALIAVPFWGFGALKLLGFGKAQKTRVICNLGSTACNPYTIADLKKLKGVRVRSHPRLHAKIYATNNFCIIGSSNASTNGLGLEGQPLKGWIEANVLSDDPKLVGSALALFEKLWESDDSFPVSAKALRIAKLAWNNRPPPSPDAAKSTTLLAACRENPKLLDSVFVAAYTEKLGDEASSKLKNVQEQAGAPIGPNASDFRKAWGYQFKDIIPESWLIDLDCRNPTKAKIRGCARATGLRFKLKGEWDLAIALRGTVISPVDGRQLRLSAAEKKSLEENARRILKLKPSRDDKPVPLRYVIRIIDHV